MPTMTFMTLHGAELAAYPDAQMALVWPAQQCTPGAKKVMEAIVIGVAGKLASVIARGAPGAKAVGAGVGIYFGSDVAEWVCRQIAQPAHVEVWTAREILEGRR